MRIPMGHNVPGHRHEIIRVMIRNMKNNIITRFTVALALWQRRGPKVTSLECYGTRYGSMTGRSASLRPQWPGGLYRARVPGYPGTGGYPGMHKCRGALVQQSRALDLKPQGGEFDSQAE
eukprot:3400083-Rhodomonas_salina.1